MFSLSFRTDNAAFQDGDTAGECARILRRVAQQLERGELAGNARDVNGNTVGEFALTSRNPRKR